MLLTRVFRQVYAIITVWILCYRNIADAIFLCPAKGVFPNSHESQKNKTLYGGGVVTFFTENCIFFVYGKSFKATNLLSHVCNCIAWNVFLYTWNCTCMYDVMRVQNIAKILNNKVKTLHGGYLLLHMAVYTWNLLILHWDPRFEILTTSLCCESRIHADSNWNTLSYPR